MQAHGQIALLGIGLVAAVVSIVRWLKFSQWELHLPLLLTRK